MEILSTVFEYVLHLNTHLNDLVLEYGIWVYVILFLIVFCETGLVITPFLPGDSLLFAAGAIAALGGMNVYVLIILFIIASILGDTVNYFIGRFAGEKMLTRYPRLIKPAHLFKTHHFFEQYGAKTIVLCRFVPIVRTVAPFVAGAGQMTYAKFMRYNIVGAFIWVLLAVPAGFFFGNIPFVKENFSLVLLGVVIVSFLPAVFEVVRVRFFSSKTSPTQTE
jgi:membrane-associated protein